MQGRSFALAARRIGQLLFIPGGMALTALPFCLAESNMPLPAAFGTTALISLLPAALLQRIPVDEVQGTCAAMSTVALAWLLIGALCGLPLYLAAHWMPTDSETTRAYGSGLNALFEGMSGITSCGLTLSDRPDLLPMAIQWWRTLCEWIGGVGVVVLMLMLIEPAEHDYALYKAEARAWRLDASLRKTAIRIWTVFAGLTVCSIIALHWAGAPWWEAINHGMTTIATGGFTIRHDSFQTVQPAVQWVAMLFMALGAVSFRTYSRLFYEGIPPWRNSTQTRGLMVLLVLGGAGFTGLVRLAEANIPLMQSLFQWTSALGTCGFSSVDLSHWTPAALVVLVLAMYIGGASGSTTGGIKVARLVWLTKHALTHLLSRMANCDQAETYRFDGEEVAAQEAGSRIKYAGLLAGLWMVSLVGGWLVLLIAMPDTPPVHLLFEAASALGSVGLSSGVTQSTMPAVAKLCLTMLMWLGRLEIISALMLLTLPLRAMRLSCSAVGSANQFFAEHSNDKT